ncbi:MAG: hypothetical protein CMH56_01975 [Myxococcales bacterium]|nr:hypothetical protein [Myxococcales bacterium]
MTFPKMNLLCALLTLCIASCTPTSDSGSSETCPEGTTRVGDQCKDLDGPDDPAPNPGTSPDASVPSPNPTDTDGGTTPPTGNVTSLPFYADVYFAVSGYMGDAEVPGNLIDTPCETDNGHQYCHRFDVEPGLEGWTGVWWQNPANNWGDVAGQGLRIEPGAQRVTFKAWSITGGEAVEFFSGYASDGFSAAPPPITLSTEPATYEVDIHCYEYDRVAGGFGWSLSTEEMSSGTQIFISDVKWTDVPSDNPIDCVALNEDRLSLGVFYDGPFTEAYAVDDETRHLYVYDETVTIANSTDAFEGATANTITYNNLDWWGLGVHWDEGTDLSDWRALHLSVNVNQLNNFQNMKASVSDGSTTHEYRLTDYGFVNATGWQSIALPLSAAEAAGVDLSAVTIPFGLGGGANGDDAFFGLDGVYLTKTYTPTEPPHTPDAGVSDPPPGEYNTATDAGVIAASSDAGTSATRVLLFEDNFDGDLNETPDPTKWTYDIGNGEWGWGNQQLEYNTNHADNVSMDGQGHLRITAREENLGTCWDGNACQYTSARINTKGLFSTQYGRIEGRFQMPSGKGLWPAFWMLGTDIDTAGWPGCGEIDIFEYRGQEPNKTQGAIHGPGYSGGNAYHGVHDNDTPLDQGFHVYAVDWEPNLIQWSIDDHVYFAIHSNQLNGGQTWAFEHPFFIILNLAVGGTFLDNPDETTSFPQTLLVDYVRVYGWGDDEPTTDLNPFCLDVFHEPPCEQMFLVDDVTRHYYIYSNTYAHSSSPDAYEGVASAKITINGGNGWWGGGIHASSAVDMSEYTTMKVALKASSGNFNNVEIRMEADGQSAITVNATSYGYTNDGQWHLLSIPLADFSGLNLNQITGLFMIGGGSESAGANLLVDAVSFE